MVYLYKDVIYLITNESILFSSLAFVDFMTGIICTPVVILTYYYSKLYAKLQG